MQAAKAYFNAFSATGVKSHAQFFSAGQDAASTKWLVAKNNQFQIIFPVGYKPLALRFATYISGVAHSDSLHFRCSLPIVLHPWNPNSNGFVTLVPRRMELYTIPPQDIYPQDWLKQLAAHADPMVLYFNQ